MMKRVLISVLALFGVGSVAAAAEPSALVDAVKRHDRTAVSALLDRGADVKATMGDGATALHFAAEGDDLPIIDALLDAGADVNAKTRFNVTALELAAQNGDRAAVERL